MSHTRNQINLKKILLIYFMITSIVQGQDTKTNKHTDDFSNDHEDWDLENDWRWVRSKTSERNKADEKLEPFLDIYQGWVLAAVSISSKLFLPITSDETEIFLEKIHEGLYEGEGAKKCFNVEIDRTSFENANDPIIMRDKKNGAPYISTGFAYCSSKTEKDSFCSIRFCEEEYTRTIQRKILTATQKEAQNLENRAKTISEKDNKNRLFNHANKNNNGNNPKSKTSTKTYKNM